MTYPPLSSGFPPTQPPKVSLYPTSLPNQISEAKNKLLVSLRIVVIVLGVLIYLCSFGKAVAVVEDTDSLTPTMTVGTTLPVMPVVILAIMAALLASIELLPTTGDYVPIVVVLALSGGLIGLGALAGMAESNLSPGWPLWVAVICALLQGIISLVMLLFKTGIINLPVTQTARFPAPYPYGLPHDANLYGQPSATPPVGPTHPLTRNPLAGSPSPANTFGIPAEVAYPPQQPLLGQSPYSSYGSSPLGGFPGYTAPYTPPPEAPLASEPSQSDQGSQSTDQGSQSTDQENQSIDRDTSSS